MYMYVCVCVCMFLYMYINIIHILLSMCVCVRVCVCVCVCVITDEYIASSGLIKQRVSFILFVMLFMCEEFFKCLKLSTIVTPSATAGIAYRPFLLTSNQP